MKDILRARLTHALLSFLLSAGLTLPLLGILEPTFLNPAVLLPVLITILIFEIAAIKRLTAVIAAVRAKKKVSLARKVCVARCGTDGRTVLYRPLAESPPSDNEGDCSSVRKSSSTATCCLRS